MAQDFSSHKGTDVEAHTVVEVRVPANGLLPQWLPPYEDVVRGFAFENAHQASFKILCCSQAGIGAVHLLTRRALLVADPGIQVGVDQPFQSVAVELVIVDQGAKAVLEAIPDLPDKGAVMEQLAVLLENLSRSQVSRLLAPTCSNS